MTIGSNIHFVVHRPGHHSPHSGYARIAEFGRDYYYGDVIKARPLPKYVMPNRLLWRLANGVIAYDRASLATELKVAWNMLKKKDGIYHILYGENLYHYLGIMNNTRNNRLVATFHQPPNVLKQHVQIDWHIRQLSAVVCVGRNQQDFFADLLSPDRVFFAPLGVDTEYFTPPLSFEDRSPDLCLFVGKHLRDFATMRGVIELVSFQRPETQFVVLTSPQSAGRLGLHSNLKILSGIPEPELLDLYRSAALLVLPLHDATANNAILEAMACGLPIVTTDVGATRDYVSPKCAVLTPPQDSQTMAKEVLHLLENPSRRQMMSEQARQQALEFSWKKATMQLQPVYEALA